MPQNQLTETQLINYLNDVVSQEAPEPIPMLRLKHISHLDLDGYGATILSKMITSYYPDGAATLEIKNILPNKLAAEMEETFAHIDDYSMIVITDLAINQTVLDMIKQHPQRDKVHVFDHHVTDVDELLPTMTVTESSPLHPGKLTCATELYYNFIINDRVYDLIRDEGVRRAIAYFVECVRVYDTFEFWPSRNEPRNNIDISYYDAPRLNTLFHIMDRTEFIDYIFDYFKAAMGNRGWYGDITTSTSARPWISKILELENNKNMKYVESAIRRLVKQPFRYTIYRDNHIHRLDYMAGIIFAEKSSPVIANTALERNTDIDFCAVVSNNQVSLYTNKPEIDVCQIAKIFGGGGHKEAAGFTIPYINAAVFNLAHFAKIIECAGQLAPGECEFEDTDVSDTN